MNKFRSYLSLKSFPQSAQKFSDPENRKSGFKSEEPSWARRSLRATKNKPENKSPIKVRAKTDVYDRKALRSTGVNLAEEATEAQPEEESSSSEGEDLEAATTEADAEAQDDAARRREKRAERRKASQQQ